MYLYSSYMKKMEQVLMVSIVGSIFCSIISFWIFEAGLTFLPYVFLSGIFMAFVQNETVSYRFLSKLFVGSLLFGFLTTMLTAARIYIVFALHGTMLPGYFWYEPDRSILFLILSFVVFMCGLVGVVLKGFYVLYKNRSLNKKKS